MTTKTQKSIHDFPMKWADMGKCFGIEIKLSGGYSACMYAGCDRQSLPNYKLISPQQYGELEVHFYKNGFALDLPKLLSQVLMPDEMQRLNLADGHIQPNVHHRTIVKIFSAIALIASME
ncbi:hypothetical protein VF04_04110 [Nostoc linckia z7]|uniref:Uncharacterized protein n=2 Tax=Nostoc linckia TaxID=92942 RepID=A0A9Q5ZG22_NOSLI|nr:hypothetical protein [Nostoc linckia]PHK42897.1 hypothetical protein VF12_00810 [Nostoc linckia z15]PHK48054.1 hypothetical protein VF13_01785 [Nostoc linckia z16]PHJ64974.1 hypothetical protein VF02_11595 [Nostoc linckia z1]PHJ70152.1 hypothetical protein VF05_11755 [Nostoc linckia z3]PHJ75053.1 hypothetical protein VF03_11915 [Nostoc linckia z2]